MSKEKPSEYLFFPIKDGKWLRDSQGKPRVYKSPTAALNNLKNHEYDTILVYAIEDIVTKEEFESLQAELANYKVEGAKTITIPKFTMKGGAE